MTDFWRYSSRNIHGRIQHPKTKYRRERVLNMWASMHTVDEIADELDISLDTVASYIKRARMAGDARAAKRRHHWRRRQEKANTRKQQIAALRDAGMEVTKIAEALNVTTRLVRLRLKEKGDA